MRVSCWRSRAQAVSSGEALLCDQRGVEVTQLSLGYKNVTLFFHLLYTAVPGPRNGPGRKQSEMWRFSASLYRTGGLFCCGAMRPEKGTPEG